MCSRPACRVAARVQILVAYCSIRAPIGRNGCQVNSQCSALGTLTATLSHGAVWHLSSLLVVHDISQVAFDSTLAISDSDARGSADFQSDSLILNKIDSIHHAAKNRIRIGLASDEADETAAATSGAGVGCSHRQDCVCRYSAAATGGTQKSGAGVS